MLRHKNIDRVCCIVLALTLLVSTLFVGAAATGMIAEDVTIGYETRLFDQSRVHTIDIVMEDWDSFVSTATSEEYSACHLVIDGESYKNVAIRGKGNTSLSSVQAYGNNRYSFKVEFDHYQSGATYHGLDKLSLNNLIQDNTYMKDYFAYTFMNKMGVAAPLCSFVQVNVNGEPWGLYLAVEGVEDAFLQRNYGKDYGELYKPDSMSFGGGRGNGRDFDMDEMAEKFGFSFGDDNSGEAQTFTMPDMGEIPAAPEGFESFGGSAADDADSSGSSGSQSSSAATATPEPTPTATPVPTATPAPANDASSGESSGDSAGGSSGDAAGSSGMPADGTTPDMSGFQMPGGEVPAMPADGTTPDMSGFQMPGGEVPAMPADGTTPDMSGFQMPGGEMPAMPADGTTPDMSGFQMPGGEVPAMPADFDPSQMGGDFQMPDMDFGGGFGGFGSSTDVKLQYSDDDPSSYSNIFNNAKTDITAADQTRLIASLKALGEGDTSVVDTDAVIRYMAVHNFLCNDDSYTGMMVHNYYLYEEDGVLAMIPWDYNLAYGTMSNTNATSSVNADIDRLVSMGSDSDRPMASWITASEEYTAQYHAVYQEFMTTVFDSGWFAQEIDRVTAMITPYVEADPTAFCTYEEFLTGAETLRQFCLKRAQSVTGQLNGDNTRVDASDLTLSAMGTMGNMGGPGGDRGGFDRSNMDFGNFGSRTGNDAAPAMPTGSADTGMPTIEMPAAAPDESGDSSGASAQQTTEKPTSVPTEESGEEEERSRPSFDGGFEMPGMNQMGNTREGWIWIVVCAALLCAALILAGSYRNPR